MTRFVYFVHHDSFFTWPKPTKKKKKITFSGMWHSQMNFSPAHHHIPKSWLHSSSFHQPPCLSFSFSIQSCTSSLTVKIDINAGICSFYCAKNTIIEKYFKLELVKNEKGKRVASFHWEKFNFTDSLMFKLCTSVIQ